jgi:formamidopyrimidine-DNA glycosylase
MPELPEVESVVRGLQRSIVGRTIDKVVELRIGTVTRANTIPSTRIGTINVVRRRGKYIVIETQACRIVIHLRMTGNLLVTSTHTMPSHVRAYFIFADGGRLLFKDVRAFGTIRIEHRDSDSIELACLGLEPLTRAFTADYLLRISTRRTAPIKNLLLNQSVIAGVGNIYACEALYRARVDPRTSAGALTKQQCKRIVREVKNVLRSAIAHVGTTLVNYRTIDGEEGNFQKFLRVYQKERCPRGHEVKRVKQAGRSTYWCPRCQRLN